MKISKSKRDLAKVISENGGWRKGSYAAQDSFIRFFVGDKPKYNKKTKLWDAFGSGARIMAIGGTVMLPNRQRTTLSRSEYFSLCPAPDADGWIEWGGGECPVGEGDRIDVKFSDGDKLFNVDSYWDWGEDVDGCNIIAYRLHKPEQTEIEYKDGVKPIDPEKAEVPSKPTLDQLLQDWRNADDFAKRKQAEADEAAAMRDERWEAAQARAGEMGVTVGLCESVAAEPEQVNPVKPVMTGRFRNAKIGSPKHYISNKGWSDEICDECGKRFGAHFDTDCNSQ